MLNLIDPCSGVPLSAVVPFGTTREVLESIFTFLPEFGLKNKSLISVERTLSANLKSPLTTNGKFPVGPILISSISSKVRGATASAKNSKSALPFVCVPVVCVGSLPLVAVVPAVVTLYKLFFHYT